ncbi:MAG: hypothetical protein A2087_11120 [Spirochaetes bacterium GWD1_61_31]|nr:MAG: hypothetical protein A2Y37_09930 [Spirochaetes bacterium GWB1_60_80]OHD34356.1 MAG: hypothetical protein A2004_07845 [Spirochaetes bacterium GWC1_61_12]OHD43127.1 MAG: hypothetical protein A2087_11120 [Spirochaetes bacterium GWD1_61_31]OHD44261.1 MAG: hypothetical protein A2Y35_06915 [Spirochaetes bacterium GWE1_60_18]OHD60379.1 MAG: hypothetical protein A2Y32_00610 [Spirochaetes bacterium GWF1_60_12]HAP43309.1 hypothetical protein [Spirochaetaceae bacterium]
MKKALAILLALALVGGVAFAQVTTAIYLEGTIQTFDLDMGAGFDYGYASLTVSGADEEDTAGFAVTTWNTALFDGDFYASVRDWNVYYNLFDAALKVTAGSLRNATYRMTDVYGLYKFTNRITGMGLLTQINAIENASIGINLPFPNADPALVDVIDDVLMGTDLGFTYKIADVGNLILLAQLNQSINIGTSDVPVYENAPVINFGFNVSAVENLALRVLYKGTFTTASTNWFNLNAKYTLSDTMSVGGYVDGTLTDALTLAAKLRFDYGINDNISALVTVDLSDITGTLGYDVMAEVTYDFLNGLSTSLDVGYDGAFYLKNYIYFYVSF